MQQILFYSPSGFVQAVRAARIHPAPLLRGVTGRRRCRERMTIGDMSLAGWTTGQMHLAIEHATRDDGGDTREIGDDEMKVHTTRPGAQ